jgi:hypothetical protein
VLLFARAWLRRRPNSAIDAKSVANVSHKIFPSSQRWRPRQREALFLIRINPRRKRHSLLNHFKKEFFASYLVVHRVLDKRIEMNLSRFTLGQHDIVSPASVPPPFYFDARDRHRDAKRI